MRGFRIFNFSPRSRDALTRGCLILRRWSRWGVIIRSGLSGLGVTLLCSVSVNLAELRRAQTRSRAVSGKDIC